MAIPEGIKTNGDVAMPRTYITGIDPTNIDDLNWAEVHSRVALLEFYRFLRNNLPGFERSVLERVADSISLRGGRYIETDKNITKEALAAGAKHPDCIYLFRRGVSKKTFEVPLAALIPQRVKNLLVVGKATAGGVHLRTAHGVLFQGQAAGVAAALAAAKGTSISQTDIKAIQKALKAAGIEIPY